MSTSRYWTAIVMLALCVAVLWRRGDVDRVPVSAPLETFPRQIDGYKSTDYPLDQEVLDVLGKGFFLNRVYRPSVLTQGSGVVPGAISLFIAYFPTQRNGQSIHSPQNCLPGSGWTFEISGVTSLTDSAGKAHEVGDYIISDGTNRAEVFYWYQSHGHIIASDYKAKVYMLADSIRYSRSDAALVRIYTALQPNETREQTHLRVADFTKDLIPLLPTYIPD